MHRLVSLSDRISEFMKAYSAVIVMFLMYSGIIEFSSDQSLGVPEILMWAVLAAVGIYGILTFVIIEGLTY